MAKFKNLNQLASAIAKVEGKKSNARIGDIREILRILIDLSLDGSTLEESGLGVEQDSALDVLFDETIKKHKSTNLQ